MAHEMKIIARYRGDLPEKFGIPRQSGLVEALRGTIVFEQDYRNDDALRGLEGFSHLWLLWEFSEAVREDWSPTVRPPRLGGNVRMGVFATRSPFRPNPIGLSCVRLLGLRKTADCGTVLEVAGGDLMDGTPIFDIKPYIPYADAHPEALGGFAGAAPETLEVCLSQKMAAQLSEKERAALTGVLANDPRPQYHADGRVYSMRFAEFTVRFCVEGKVLIVTELKRELSYTRKKEGAKL